MIQDGGVVAIPTDTVYGIACSVHNSRAIDQMYEIKDRELTKAIPVLISSLAQLNLIVTDFNDEAKLLATDYWPGALTMLMEKRKSLPDNLSIYPTVGVRMPDHDWLRKIMNETGPLAATSANISGAANPTTAQEVLDQLEGRIDLIIDGGKCEGGIPSTVVDISSGSMQILREGGIAKSEIMNLLKKYS